jgi:hypothetical protein
MVLDRHARGIQQFVAMIDYSIRETDEIPDGLPRHLVKRNGNIFEELRM